MTALLLTVLAGHGRPMTAEEVHTAIPPALRTGPLAATAAGLDSLCTMQMATHESLPPAPGCRFPRAAYQIRRPLYAGKGR